MSTEDFDLLKEMNSGEKELYNKCLKYVSDDFKVIPNAIFQRHDEGTNQIDLIIISKKGIFVVEMKDYKGWIFGDENHINWTQSLNAGKGQSKQYKFRNPIKQNENHIKTLKKILLRKGYDNLPVYNVVVFGNDAVLKEVTKSIDVVNLKDIGKAFEKYRDLVITTEEISNIYDFLYGEIIKEKNAIGEHINYVNSLQSEKSTIESSSRVNQDLTNNHAFDRNKSLLRVLSRYISKHKKIVVIILIIILSLLLTKGLMLLGIVVLGLLGIKYKEGRAVGLAILMIFILLSNNSPEDFSSSSNNNQESNSSEIASVEDTSEQAGEISSNSIEDDLLEEDSTVTLSDSVNNSQENNDQSSSTEIADVKDAPIIESSDNQSVEKVEDSNVSQEDTEIETNETTKEVTSVKEDEKLKMEETIFVGSPMSLVEELLGEPDKVTTDGTSENWHYKSSNISYSENGLVNGWNNRYGVLNSGMQQKKEGAEAIDIGSTKEEVLNALGSPTEINSRNQNVWYYAASEISFNENNLVNGWNNRYGVLNSGMKLKKEGAEAIDIGSTKKDVLNALGSPTKINSRNQNIWYYNASEINFNEKNLVNGWNNRYDVLNSGMQQKKEGAEAIDIGSTKEEVLNALGSPTKINPRNQNIWYYNASEISFSESDLVNGWNNRYGVLNLGMQQEKEGAKGIDIGSTKEEVLNALGSPTEINSRNQNIWYYDASEISFNENNLVNGWNNRYGVLNSGMQQKNEGAEKIDVGSTKEDVLSALGSPSKIEPSNINTWYYKQAYINFDNNALVESWKDVYNILSDKVSQ
jgi:outer membrane protein assembly factor BamE (lipoprotein component of BamABCDE complex)